VSPKELYPLLEGIGLKKNSVSPQVSLLKKRGMIEMPSMGLYTVLREGIVEAKKRGLLASKGANGVDAHG
jgi:predicted alternative tryptophan synthase beta-subunit